jgi:uncharacterized protein YqcC (DUF446 family)
VDETVRTRHGGLAEQIESELRRLGAWDAPAPPGPATSAFGSADRSFTQWLRYDLVPRLREVAAGRAEPPEHSMVGTQALRELDGNPEAERLVDLLLALDRVVERG